MFGRDIDWGGVAKEGAIIFIPGADLVDCWVKEGGCSWFDWGMGAIGVIPVGKIATAAVKAARAADKLADARRLAKVCCFVAGTLVSAEDGLVPIEGIEIGDKVWAQDVETGEVALKPVTDLIRRHNRQIWVVRLESEDGEIQEFKTTDDHPWRIPETGWVHTEDLEPGMAAVTRNGQDFAVADVSETETFDATYNLTVADFETYFVGKIRILVHNCPGPKGLMVSPNRAPGLKNVQDRVDFRGDPNSIIRGSNVARRGGGKRAFVTDESGRIIREITPQRVKERVTNTLPDGTTRETFRKIGSPSADDLNILDNL